LRVVLDIERLVLEGISVTPNEAARIRAAAEVEIQRLFAVGEVPARLRSSGATPSLAAPALTIASGAAPENIGAQIARCVHAGLGDVS
jgi:hypothetical protein